MNALHIPSLSRRQALNLALMSVLILVLLAALLLVSCAKQTPPAKSPLAVTVQSVAVVASSDSPQATRYTAVLAPSELVNLAFKVPGYVAEIDKGAMDKGGPVAKGQVLAKLRDDDYRARLAQARSNLDETKASLTLAASDQERNAKLIHGEVISKSEYDKTVERRAVTQARSAQAAALLEQAEINLRDTELASPMDGLVVSRSVERGSLVGQGSVAFVLADLSSVKAVFAMPDQEVAKVKLGDALEVTAEALPGRRFTGLVSAVSPSADPKSRAFDVEVRIANPDLTLKDGMVATVRRELKSGPELAAVPLQALARPGAGDGYVVHVLTEENGRTLARDRAVAVGGITGNLVTVVSGLNPGEQVIVRGTTLALDGQEVRVIR